VHKVWPIFPLQPIIEEDAIKNIDVRAEFLADLGAMF